MSKSKYHVTIKGVEIDVYDLLVAYKVKCPALQHGIKKALMPGKRHAKSVLQDKQEAAASFARAVEIEQEKQARKAAKKGRKK